MTLSKQEQIDFSKLVAKAVVEELKAQGLLGTKKESNSKNAYQKTESLLYNYMNFKKIIKEYGEEMEAVSKYGVSKESKSVVEYKPKGGTSKGLESDIEATYGALHTIQRSIDTTQGVVNAIDSALKFLENDPYYSIIPLRYFDGCTQEDIAARLGVSQVTISLNKNRLVQALSLRLFPDLAIKDLL